MPRRTQNDPGIDRPHGPIDGTASGGERLTLTIRNLADIIESRYGDPARFCSQVKLWLAQHGITQAGLAREIGMNVSNLNRWLNHHNNPSLRNMLLIDEALERLIADREGS